MPVPPQDGQPAAVANVSNEFGQIRVVIRTYWDYSSGEGVDTGIPFVFIEFIRNFDDYEAVNFEVTLKVLDPYLKVLTEETIKSQVHEPVESREFVIEDVPTAALVKIESWRIGFP